MCINSFFKKVSIGLCLISVLIPCLSQAQLYEKIYYENDYERLECRFYVRDDGVYQRIVDPNNANNHVFMVDSNAAGGSDDVHIAKYFARTDSALVNVDFRIWFEDLQNGSSEIQLWLNKGMSLVFSADGSVLFKHTYWRDQGQVESSPGLVKTNQWHDINLQINYANREATIVLDGQTLGSFLSSKPEFPSMNAIQFIAKSGGKYFVDNLKIHAMSENPPLNLSFPIRSNQAHPSLLMTESDFENIRVKTIAGENGAMVGDPFAQIRKFAAERWQDGSHKYNIVQYINTPKQSDRQPYIDNMLASILAFETSECSWSLAGHSHVGYANAFYWHMIALDLIHDHISDADLKKAQTILYRFADLYRVDTMQNGWTGGSLGRDEVAFAPMAIFLLYLDQQDPQLRKVAQKYADLHLQGLYKFTLEDGSWAASPAYSHARMARGRVIKSDSMHIFQRAGLHDFYRDEQLLKVYEWMVDFSRTPMGNPTLFGDNLENTAGTYITTRIPMRHSYLPFLLTQSEPRAQKIARQWMWFHDWTRKSSATQVSASFASENVLRYILGVPEVLRPTIPKSSLWENTGPALWGADNKEESFQGILYSQRNGGASIGSASHSHPDTNSLSLSAYGQELITNSGGADYAGKPVSGRWSDEVYQNIVLLDGQTQHLAHTGSGLIDGIVGGSMEFGTTGSGGAIDGATHQRSLALMHAGQHNNGYFALFDQISTNAETLNADIYLQPNTLFGSVINQIPGQLYQAPIDARFNSHSGDGYEQVNIFYATQPTSVEQKPSAKTNVSDNQQTTALVSSYIPVNKEVHALTLIFPEDSTHTAAGMTRLPETDQVSGARVEHTQSIIDILYQSKKDVLINDRSSSFKAKALVARHNKDQGEVISFLAIQGTEYKANANSYGFSASEKVSLQLDGGKGLIHASRPTSIAFYFKGVRQLFINGERVNNITIKDNKTSAIVIPKGRHSIELLNSEHEPLTSKPTILNAGSVTEADSEYVVRAQANANGVDSVATFKYWESGNSNLEFLGVIDQPKLEGSYTGDTDVVARIPKVRCDPRQRLEFQFYVENDIYGKQAGPVGSFDVSENCSGPESNPEPSPNPEGETPPAGGGSMSWLSLLMLFMLRTQSKQMRSR